MTRSAGRGTKDGAPPAPALSVVAFWRAAGYGRWFAKSDMFDALVRMRLLRLHEKAARGTLDAWDATAEGALALLILLDQAPRNMFRGTPRAFATDGRALAVADAAIRRGFDRRISPALRHFFYLPFEHSEDPAAQARCVRLMSRMRDADALRWAEIHADVIARFGRFPHRNAILGRASTQEEIVFLERGGFSG